MLRKIISLSISLIIIVTGLILTNLSLPFLSNYLGYDLHGNGLMGITFATMILTLPGLFISSWLGLVLAPFITKWLFNYAERLTVSLSGVPTSDILVMIFGIGIGLILANLIGSPFSRLPVIGPFIPIVLSLVLSVVGAKLALRKHNDIVEFFNRIPTRKSVKPVDETKSVLEGPLGDRLYSSNKLLDTSVIIDVTYVFNCAVDLAKNNNLFRGITYLSYVVNCVPLLKDPYSFQSCIHEYYFTAGGGHFFAEPIANFGLGFACLFSCIYIVFLVWVVRKKSRYHYMVYAAISITIFRSAWYGLNYPITTILYFAPAVLIGYDLVFSEKRRK